MRQDPGNFAAKNLAKSKLPRYVIEMAFQEKVHVGTAVAGTTASITLTDDAAGASDYYEGMVIEITAGAGAGQKRAISAYDGTNKVATVAVDWTIIPDATSAYRIDDLYYLTSHAQTDSAIVAGAPAAYNVIEKLAGASQQVYPDEGRATIGAISFSVVDKAAAITSQIYTKLAAGYGLKGKRIRFYLGYDGLAWEDYCLIQTQIVDSIDFNPGGSYDVQCADVNRSVRADIFEPKMTTLSKSIDATQLLIPVYSVWGFETVAHGSSYSDAPNVSVGYIQIQKEVIRWTGTKTDPVLGLCFVADQRGALNTQAVAHTIDENTSADRRTKVTEYFYLEMPGPKLAYAILTGTLVGQGVQLPANWCLAVASDYVKLSDFTNIGTDWWDPSDDALGFILRFEGLKKQDAKKFLEKEIYLLLGAFSPVYTTGELGLKRMTSVLAGASYVDTLDRTNVVSWTALKHDMQSVKNQIQIDWNWDALQGKFTRTNLLIDADSINIHGAAKLSDLKFLGLHGSRHSYAALTSRFNSYRDRYAGPPLKFDATLLPSKNVLEVGDIVRVQPPNMRDYVVGATFDRSMEVQAVKIDWITGKVTASLFGSSQAASAITPDSTGVGNGTGMPPLDDSWYTSEGADLVAYLAANYPGSYTDAGGILTITGSVVLAGAPSLANAVYCYSGDITVNANQTVAIGQNVQLRVKGHLTVNGTIDGKGAGLPGGTLGVPGYFGNTEGGGGQWTLLPYSTRAAQAAGLNNVVPSLDVYTQGGILAGTPTDLRGTSGGKGGDVVGWGVPSNITGGAGGNGGAGLLIVCRGMSFGTNAKIDLSGGNGSLGASYTPSWNPVTYYAGTGAGGAPGALVVLLDGANSVLPDPEGHVIQRYGACQVQGHPMSANTANNVSYNSGDRVFPSYSYYVGNGGTDVGEAGYRIQYLPENTAPIADINQPLPDVLNFTATQNGTVAVFKWMQAHDTRLAGYDLRYGKSGVTNWQSATPLTFATRGTEMTSAAIPPGHWTAFIKAVSVDGIYSSNAASVDFMLSNPNPPLASEEQAPGWPGTCNGFLVHPAGVLVPKGQYPAAHYAAWEDFLDFCPDPVPVCTYDTNTFDIGYVGHERVWGAIAPAQGVGVPGMPTVEMDVDVWEDGADPQAWTPWTVGVKSLRYARGRITHAPGTAPGMMTGFNFTIDVGQPVVQSAANVAIGAGGTAIVFPAAFRAPPKVKVTVSGPLALIPTVDAITTTGCIIYLFNTSGTSVSGTVTWEASGE